MVVPVVVAVLCSAVGVVDWTVTWAAVLVVSAVLMAAIAAPDSGVWTEGFVAGPAVLSCCRVDCGAVETASPVVIWSWPEGDKVGSEAAVGWLLSGLNPAACLAVATMVV